MKKAEDILASCGYFLTEINRKDHLNKGRGPKWQTKFVHAINKNNLKIKNEEGKEFKSKGYEAEPTTAVLIL